MAAKNDHTDVVALLLDYGANIEAESKVCLIGLLAIAHMKTDGVKLRLWIVHCLGNL